MSEEDIKPELSSSIKVKVERCSPSPEDTESPLSIEPAAVFVKQELDIDEQPAAETPSAMVKIEIPPPEVKVEVKVEYQPQEQKTEVEDKEYQCRACKRKFSCKSSLTNHQRKKGECGLARVFLPCSHPDCYKTFKNEALLRSHMRSHSEGKPYPCAQCGKFFKWEATARKHCGQKMERTYKCPNCPKMCASWAAVEAHNRVHTGVKPFQCPECARSFTHKANMRRHLLCAHSKTINLTCELCGKVCARPSRLKYHMRVHWVDNKPFKCLHCRKTYSHKLHIERHYRKKHPGIEYIAQHTDAQVANKGWELLKKNNELPGDFILPDSHRTPIEEDNDGESILLRIAKPELVTVQSCDESSSGSSGTDSDEEPESNAVEITVKSELALPATN